MENGNMTPLVPRQDGRLEWGNGVVSMLFDIPPFASATL